MYAVVSKPKYEDVSAPMTYAEFEKTMTDVLVYTDYNRAIKKARDLNKHNRDNKTYTVRKVWYVMTCYFGTDLANRIMQENIDRDFDTAMAEIEETLIQVKETYLSTVYADGEDRKRFWTALFHMVEDRIEYLINDVENRE